MKQKRKRGKAHAGPADPPASTNTVGDAMSMWSSSTLPGCFGHPCEMRRANGGVARVWQASQVTARGVWCWQLNDGDVHVVRGNRGVAKAAASKALRRSEVRQPHGKSQARQETRQDRSPAVGPTPCPTIMNSPTFRRLGLPMLRGLFDDAGVSEIVTQLNVLVAE